MKIFNYPLVHFPFHKLFETLTNQTFIEDDEIINEACNALINDDEFMELYRKFAKYVEPFFENGGLFVAPTPIFRIHQVRSNPFFFSKIEDYKIDKRSKIIFVPLTPLFGTNSFRIESRPKLRDFNIINMNIGQFMIHECHKDILDIFKNETGMSSATMFMRFLKNE